MKLYRRFKNAILFTGVILISSCNVVESESKSTPQTTIEIQTPQESSFTTSTNFGYTPISNFSMYLGGGYDSLTQKFMGIGIDPNSVKTKADTSTIVKSGYVIIEDSLSIFHFINDMIHSFPGENKYSLSPSQEYQFKSDIEDNRVSLAVVTVVRHHETELSYAKTNDYAKMIFNSSTDPEQFYRMYGNSYQSQALLGGYQIKTYNVHYNSNTVSRDDIKKALFIKYKDLYKHNVSEEEKLFMEHTLKKSHSQHALFSYQSSSPVLIPDLIHDDETFMSADTAFHSYYQNPTLGLATLASKFSSYDLIEK